jgi:hypothetical protein
MIVCALSILVPRSMCEAVNLARLFMTTKESGMRKRFLPVGLMVLGVFLISGVLHSAHAALPAGDMCWKVTKTQSEKGLVNPAQTFTVRMHLKALDASMGAAYGYVTVPGDNPFILSGNYFKIGANIYLNMVISQKHTNTWRDSGTMQITLNASTLSGTFYEIRSDFDTKAKVFDSGYSSGNITKLAVCPP